MNMTIRTAAKSLAVVAVGFAAALIVGCSGAPGEHTDGTSNDLYKCDPDLGCGPQPTIDVCRQTAVPQGGIPASYTDSNYYVNQFLAVLRAAGCEGTGGDTSHLARAVARAGDLSHWWMESECPNSSYGYVMQYGVNNGNVNASIVHAYLPLSGTSNVPSGTACDVVSPSFDYFTVDFDPGCPGCTITRGGI
jgi:hypothetical protein